MAAVFLTTGGVNLPQPVGRSVCTTRRRLPTPPTVRRGSPAGRHCCSRDAVRCWQWSPRLYPLMPRVPVLRGMDDVRRLRGMSVRARDLFCVSWHPVGTCRVGRDAHEGVVGFDQQVHGVDGLYIVDASSVSGPPAVNSLLTIMAFADRAAERVGERLA